MALVIDVSAVLGLAFEDEDAKYSQATIEAVSRDVASVPTVFWFELRNALVMGERRRRNSPEQTAEFLADLSLLDIQLDASPRESVVLEIARQQNLTVYDAAYLELAQRKSLPIATLDAALIQAATKLRIGVFSAVGP